MKILIFGGTTEGRQAAERLAGCGHTVTVATATGLGAEAMEGIKGLELRTGRLSRNEIEDLVGEYDLCVDATHPYALEISRYVREACEKKKIRLEKVNRQLDRPQSGLCFDSFREAAAFLSGVQGNILLTTGSKNLAEFGELDRKRLYVRVLPCCESIKACEENGIAHKNIIAMYGPFSVQLNEAMIRQYDIRWLVTKNSGRQGGFPEKEEAARRTGIQMVVILPETQSLDINI